MSLINLLLQALTSFGFFCQNLGAQFISKFNEKEVKDELGEKR
jgi:hypothetical protein